MKIINLLLLTLISAALLFSSVRGILGNPTEENINSEEWVVTGPLELSPERGRFALLYSYVENNSFYFSLPIARFATPDLGYSNGNYVSLFAPGLSFLLIPGYLLGKSLGIAQVGAYTMIAVFGLLNLLLVRAIAIKLGAHHIAASIASFCFLFATPAFAYSVSLYQHHPSTFLILISIYLLLKWNNFWSLLLVWLACAASIPLDYPNLFLMFPIGLFALGRFVVTSENAKKYEIKIKWPYVFTFLFLIPPLLFFFWFNQMSYGNPLQFSGTVASVKVIDEQGLPAAPETENDQNSVDLVNPEQQDKSAVAFFNTRFLLNGFHTHFVSLDRGVLMYAPIVLIALAGMYFLYKENKPWTRVLIAVMAMNIVLYSLWGDPYGGWAFGSRYLVPSYALAMIFAAIALSKLRRNIPFLLVLTALFVYSFGVNTIGALTTNRVPPKVEVLGLEALSGVQEKYTYGRNADMLSANQSKSFAYNTYFSQYVTAWEYAYILFGVGTLFYLYAVLAVFLAKEK